MNHFTIHRFCTAALLIFLLQNIVSANDRSFPVSIIPQPKNVIIGEGKFIFRKTTKIVILDQAPGLQEIARLCSTQIHYFTNLTPTIIRTNDLSTVTDALILKIITDDSTLGKEGYTLSVHKHRIVIDATSNAGMFYGMQSFVKLF
jgi:hexosaminidase